jgi:hypothetical protein
MRGVMQKSAQPVSKQTRKSMDFEEGSVGLLTLNNGSQGTTVEEAIERRELECGPVRVQGNVSPSGWDQIFWPSLQTDGSGNFLEPGRNTVE